jgi:hypothetical protein
MVEKVQNIQYVIFKYFIRRSQEEMMTKGKGRTGLQWGKDTVRTSP